VDIFDLTLLLGNFSSASYVIGDLNNNGRVDIFDLTILLGNFGGAGALSPTPLPTGSSSNLNSNLVDYWKMNEAAGDILGAYANKNFTVSGTINSAAGKVYSTARLFPGPGTLAVGTRNNNDVRFGDADVAFAFWWYEYTTPSGSFPNLYHYLWQQDGWDGGYTIGLNGTNQLFFQSAIGGGVADTLHSSVITSPLNTWHFAILWYDQATSTLHLKVDNGPETTQVGSTHLAGTNPARIGSDSGTGNVMNGRIGPIAVWNRLLTVSEMTQLWNNGNGLTYPFP